MEARTALFLDVDGTLVEIAATPNAVTVPPSLRNTLQNATRRVDGALALVSGRSIRDLDVLFAPAVFPAAGQHGLERRNAQGAVTRADIDTTSLDPIRERLLELQAQFKGLLFEDKGFVLAMHYRLAPQLESMVRGVMMELILPLNGLFELRPGKCVFEVVSRGSSKRSAVEAFMAEPPFAKCAPIFIGDDVGDEEAFEAVNAMGGYSIRVGYAINTAARYGFTDVAAVTSWLDAGNFLSTATLGAHQWPPAISNSA